MIQADCSGLSEHNSPLTPQNVQIFFINFSKAPNKSSFLKLEGNLWKASGKKYWKLPDKRTKIWKAETFCPLAVSMNILIALFII